VVIQSEKEQTMKHEKITIGLFGTCDNIKWRDKFMKTYDEMGISYFNPMIDNWTERLEMSRKGLCPNPTEEENYYLHNAEIILFPILKESLGSGSLGELGFSVQTVARNVLNGKSQMLVVLIDDDCTASREKYTEEQIKRSIKDRALVKSKLRKLQAFPNVTIVKTLNDMFTLSLELYEFLEKGRANFPIDEELFKTA
jgi:hypothetical protein